MYLSLTGERVEFTYDASVSLWLLPEVQIFKDLGYSVALSGNPPTFDSNNILAAIALPALAEPTFVGELVVAGTAIVLAGIFVYQYTTWVTHRNTFDDDLHRECLSYYIPCIHHTPQSPCYQCFNYCKAQNGLWRGDWCPGVTQEYQDL